jgi:hypothetical protein
MAAGENIEPGRRLSSVLRRVLRSSPSTGSAPSIPGYSENRIYDAGPSLNGVRPLTAYALLLLVACIFPSTDPLSCSCSL